MRGQVPKRSEDRLRRNEPEIPIDKIEAEGPVSVPPLNLPYEPHPMVVDFYESLAQSAFAIYYEPSDWEYARVACHILQTIVSTRRPSAEMYKALQSAMSNLLVTEGDRRRMRIEIARDAQKSNKEDAQVAQIIDMYRKRMEESTKK